jgi:hypothetical protein
MKAILAALIALASFAPAFAFGEAHAAVGTRDLIDRPFEYDGKTVSLEGEAIGESMRRGEWAWANLLDGYAAIGVFAPAKALASIESYGSSRGKGDSVRVLGTFRRACPEHGGDMDIHALSIEIVERGKPTPRPVDPLVLIFTPLSFILAALCFLLWRKRKAVVGRVGTALNRQER